MVAKRHIAEPDKRTLCGRRSNPVPFISEAQARILRDGSRAVLCRKCDQALEAKDRKHAS